MRGIHFFFGRFLFLGEDPRIIDCNCIRTSKSITSQKLSNDRYWLRLEMIDTDYNDDRRTRKSLS